MANGIVFGL